MNEIVVSVVMPAFNSEKTIKQSVESVLNQTFRDFELIVVDDGSTDDTLTIVNSIRDSRVRVVSLSQNKGANYARNKGILESKGKYIAFIDSDDCWTHEKLEVQTDYMKRKGLSVSFTPFVIESNNQIVPGNYEKYSDNYCEVENTLKKYNIIRTATLIVEKNVLIEMGMFDEKLPRLQDYELVIRIVQKYSIGCCPRQLLIANTQFSKISMDQDALFKALGIIISKHFGFLEFEEENIFFNSLFSEDDLIDEKALYIVMKSCEKHQYEFMRQIVKEQNLRMQRNNQIQGILNKENFLKIKSEKFVIWGAGDVGRRMYQKLKDADMRPAYFVVSGVPDISQIDGIEVVNVREISTEDYVLLLGVARKTQLEILNSVNEYHFRQIITV